MELDKVWGAMFFKASPTGGPETVWRVFLRKADASACAKANGWTLKDIFRLDKVDREYADNVRLWATEGSAA